MGKTIRFKKIPFKIIGILSKKGENTFGQDQDDVILTPISTVQKRILSTTYYQAIFVSAIDESATDEAAKAIQQVLRTNHKLQKETDDDFTVRTQAELISTFFNKQNLNCIAYRYCRNIINCRRDWDYEYHVRFGNRTNQRNWIADVSWRKRN